MTDPVLGDALDRSCALLIDGPAGIGKTYRLDGLLAGAADWRVLRAAPAEAETRLIGSALVDLCDRVDDADIATLPSAQAVALAAALLRAEPAGPNPPQAVAVAFTSLLRRLAAAGPVLLAIDDIQWLDPQTADVLAFAVRRLPERNVAVIATLRTTPGAAEPDLVARLAAALPMRREQVAPLEPEQLERVVRARLGRGVSASAVRAGIEASGGNPLFAIEVVREQVARGTSGGEPVAAFPSSLAELIGRHVAELPPPTQRCLATVAALRRPTVGVLRRLDVLAPLAEAERAGLVRIDGHDVAFTHPLYAAAAYDRLAPSERMALHTRLAGVVAGGEERARHLALGSDEPDEAIAVALDAARDRALGRGALQAAVEASELAIRATPPGSAELATRRVQLGRLLYRVGDASRAKQELTAAVDAARGTYVEGRALHELARVVGDTESETASARLEFEALEHAGTDTALRADIHMGLAQVRNTDWIAALEHARVACELVDADPDAPDEKRAAALAALAGPKFYAGEGADVDACRRAMELEAGGVSAPVSDRAVSILAYLYLWTDDFGHARELLQQAYDLSVDEGDEASRAYTLSNLAVLEWRAGNWARTESHLAECLDMFDRSGNAYFAHVARQHRLWLDVSRGEYANARAAASADAELGARLDRPQVELRARALLGFCALAEGDAPSAAAELDRYRALFRVNNAREPALRQLAGEHIEALVAVGRLADARLVLDELVADATRLGRTASLAAAARAEALLLAAHGDAAGAVAAAQRSLALYDRVERRFDRARTLLTLGRIHRRFRRKGAARVALTEAYDEFAALGADAFAAIARSEAGRVGLRTVPDAGLTETEQRVADLAASGRTSAEIGAALFVSPKTVASHLTRIYRKLGVRNRTELTAHLSAARGESARIP